jgi:hypothetical protein
LEAAILVVDVGSASVWCPHDNKMNKAAIVVGLFIKLRLRSVFCIELMFYSPSAPKKRRIENVLKLLNKADSKCQALMRLMSAGFDKLGYTQDVITKFSK